MNFAKRPYVVVCMSGDDWPTVFGPFKTLEKATPFVERQRKSGGWRVVKVAYLQSSRGR